MDKNLETVGSREEKVEINFQKSLIKHLSENEVICTDWGGSGLRIDERPFGIKGFNHLNGQMFPFKKQTIVSCQSCYNGVRKLCTYCQQPLPRHTNQCSCEKAEWERKEEGLKKEIEKFESAEKITLDEALKKYVFLFVDNWDKYFETDNFECEENDYLDELNDGLEEEDKVKIEELRIFVTKETRLTFDAGSILEDNTEDLHEEAYERIGNDKIAELQEMLDRWAETVKDNTTTYYPDYKIAIKF